MSRPWWLLRLAGRPVEVWSALGAVLWGAFLLLGNHDLDQNPNYTVAVRLLPDDWWEAGAVLTGVLQLAMACTGWRICRIATGLTMAFGWVLMGLSFLASGNGAPAFVLYAAWGAINIHAMIRTWCRRPCPQPPPP